MARAAPRVSMGSTAFSGSKGSRGPPTEPASAASAQATSSASSDCCTSSEGRSRCGCCFIGLRLKPPRTRRIRKLALRSRLE